MGWYVLLVGLVALERVAELVVSKRNEQWSRAQGGVESGAEHYPVMVVLHTGLLVACVLEAWLGAPHVRPRTGLDDAGGRGAGPGAALVVHRDPRARSGTPGSSSCPASAG